MKGLIFTLLLLLFSSCKKHSKQLDNILVREQSLIEKNENQKLNGYIKLYYSSNKIKTEGHFSNGIKNGFWKYYYENGNVKKEGNYANGIKDGFWKTYYKNGNAESEGHYTSNTPYGFWKYYNKDHSKTETANL